ncbi:MAG: DUF3696 domain-containing protein [Lachnospiraceae bacterium]|nr:DUF3696 domain-containing protein [Lachnospiraceae bacterium]
MIKEIKLKNFKCFEEIQCNLKNVNILTGLNGMGKSTLIQALLLLRQSVKSKTSNGLQLKGEYVQLGLGKDVLYEKATREQIGFQLEYDGGKSTYLYGYDAESNEQGLMDYEACGDGICELFEDRFTYLSAYRIQPQMVYGITNKSELQKHKWGNNGEFSLQYLSEYGSTDIENTQIYLDSMEEHNLLSVVNAWLQEISPDVRVRVDVNQLMNLSELRYEFVEGENTTNLYRCVNVGFGLTYVLPVIITLVSANVGDVIILENPEAHIHPRGQRILGELISRAGASGAQIIVETHSDHILNGVRLSVKNNQIKKQNVGLFYFYKDAEDNYRHKYVSPHILENGRIDKWPKGFFDEWDVALMDLI